MEAARPVKDTEQEIEEVAEVAKESPDTGLGLGPSLSGHCLRCKKVTTFENVVYQTSKNNRNRASGTCGEPTCQKPVSKFVALAKPKGKQD